MVGVRTILRSLAPIVAGTGLFYMYHNPGPSTAAVKYIDDLDAISTDIKKIANNFNDKYTDREWRNCLELVFNVIDEQTISANCFLLRDPYKGTNQKYIELLSKQSYILSKLYELIQRMRMEIPNEANKVYLDFMQKLLGDKLPIKMYKATPRYIKLP